MKTRGSLVAIALGLCATALGAVCSPAWSEHVKMIVEPGTKLPDVKTITSGDLKEAVTYAAQKGDINQADAQELINKINDIEILMAQFDFIQEQERRMVSSIGSPFH